ncbi:MAG TPA: hypothetical protein EYP49_10015 [Anaerolineae bacterium]|nr:hypothetical protein [Anaerolineae bacterium]
MSAPAALLELWPLSEIQRSPIHRFSFSGAGCCGKPGKGNGVCEEARVAVGAVCPRPMRLRRGEKVLRGEKVSPAVISKFVEVAAGEVKPIPYIYWSPGYKRKVVRNLLSEAVEQAWQGAKSA